MEALTLSGRNHNEAIIIGFLVLIIVIMLLFFFEKSMLNSPTGLMVKYKPREHTVFYTILIMLLNILYTSYIIINLKKDEATLLVGSGLIPLTQITSITHYLSTTYDIISHSAPTH